MSLASGEPAGTYLPDMVTSFPLTSPFWLFTSQVGSVATQIGDRAESDVSRDGTQDRNGAWTLLGHTLPHFPPFVGQKGASQPTDLTWCGPARRVLSPILSVSRSHMERQAGRSILNTGRLPIPQLPPRLWRDRHSQCLVCLAPPSRQANRGSCYLKIRETTVHTLPGNLMESRNC